MHSLIVANIVYICHHLEYVLVGIIGRFLIFLCSDVMGYNFLIGELQDGYSAVVWLEYH